MDIVSQAVQHHQMSLEALCGHVRCLSCIGPGVPDHPDRPDGTDFPIPVRSPAGAISGIISAYAEIFGKMGGG